MPIPVKTSMPEDVDIGAAYTLQIAALSPTDGSAVAGVKISNMTIECEALGAGPLDSGVFRPVLIRTGAPV